MPADDDFFIRYESAVPNMRGAHPGVFALANGLAHEGLLTSNDLRWWMASNYTANEAYPRPDAKFFDPEVYPRAASWFRASATELLHMTSGYLTMLNRYSVPWVELRTAYPGHVIYQDDVQVVTTPFTYAQDWILTTGRFGDGLRS